MTSEVVKEYEKLTTSMEKLDGVTVGKMFGKACLKIHGKAFIAQHLEVVVFKLTGKDHEKAIGLKGAKLWDPSGKGRPMKEWVALEVSHKKLFLGFTKAARKYVNPD